MARLVAAGRRRGRNGAGHRYRMASGGRRHPRLPSRRSRDRSHARTARSASARCAHPAATRTGRPGGTARGDQTRSRGAAQGGARNCDRRDVAHARRCFGSGRCGAVAQGRVRPRRGDDASGDASCQPGGGGAACRARSAAGSGCGLPFVGGSGACRAAGLRSARNGYGRPCPAGAGTGAMGQRRSGGPRMARSTPGSFGRRGAANAGGAGRAG